MNVVEINRKSNEHKDYYGVVELDYEEVIMIANALYQYHKNTNSEFIKQISLFLKNNWSDFRDMVCYGQICASLVDKD